MSTPEAPRGELDTTLLGTKSLQDWHTWLVTNRKTGENEWYLRVPCSRYGRNSDECSWWAIAAELAYREAVGGDEDIEEALDFLMGLSVNDHPDIGSLVRDFRYALPEALKEMLGGDEGINEVVEGEQQ